VEDDELFAELLALKEGLPRGGDKGSGAPGHRQGDSG
jgi:hypothetical protein